MQASPVQAPLHLLLHTSICNKRDLGILYLEEEESSLEQLHEQEHLQVECTGLCTVQEKSQEVHEGRRSLFEYHDANMRTEERAR